jgi:hypothetical protein
MTGRSHIARRALAATTLPGAAAAKEHVDGCLSCQASAAQDRRLQRRLAALRYELIPAPAGLVTLVLARMEAAPGASSTRGPIIAGASVLAAAAAAAAMVAARRRGVTVSG